MPTKEDPEAAEALAQERFAAWLEEHPDGDWHALQELCEAHAADRVRVPVEERRQLVGRDPTPRVAHTHDDMGWVQTIEHYFAGISRRTLPLALSKNIPVPN